MKVNWIVDTYILESASTQGDLLGEIKKAGHNLHATKYVPFAKYQDYGPVGWEHEPTVLYGTHGFLNKCKQPFIPGAYGLGPNMNCAMYYAHVPQEWMLNKDFVMLPFQVIKDDPWKVFNLFQASRFFIRPNSGFKTFAGMVVNAHDVNHELSGSQQLTSVMPDTICLVAPVQNLQGEFRFLVVDGKVVDGSEYRWNNVLDIRLDYDMDCFRMAEKMAQHSWQPDAIYTCDVALTEKGPKIIELNSFSCAGLYAMNKRKVVDAVSEYAWRDFHGET